MGVLGRGLAAGNGEQLRCQENFWINREKKTGTATIITNATTIAKQQN